MLGHPLQVFRPDLCANLRNIVLVSGGAVLVTVAILIAVIQWFNWDRYRGDAARWIGSSTWPDPFRSMGPSTSNFSPPRASIWRVSRLAILKVILLVGFFTWTSVYARLNLATLFTGKLVLDELRLDRPKAQFEVNPAGHSNWQVWQERVESFGIENARGNSSSDLDNRCSTPVYEYTVVKAK